LRTETRGHIVMDEQTGLPTAILDVTTLPTLPQTLVELIDACNQKDVNVHELGTKVERDVSVSTRVLQLVNSAFIGARSSITDIAQAVIYLGVDTTRNLAISVAVHETFNSTNIDEAINLPDFWHHSLLTAVLAKSLAQATGTIVPSEAYLTGLLHDLGKLLLLHAFPDQYRKILKESGPVDLVLQEREILGITHPEAAALLIGSWLLQPEIADAVVRHHHVQNRTMAVSALAKILFCANQLGHCPIPDIAAVAGNVCELLKIDKKMLLACTEDSVEAVDEIAGNMGIKVSRCSAFEKQNSSNAVQAEANLVNRVLTFSEINGFLDNLVKAEGLERAFQVIEESLHILFESQGCLFLLPDGTTGELAVCGSVGNPLFGKAKELRLRVSETGGLLSSCREDLVVMDSFTYFKENEPDAFDQALLDIFQTAGFVAVPLVISGHEPGLIIIGVTPAGADNLHGRENTLLLLAGHAGMRFRLEKTYRKHAEELAVARVGAVTDVARSIAHEISNPIAVLQNYLVVLGLKLKGHPELVTDLEIISREIRRIGEISDQLQDLSGQVTGLPTEPVNLNELISNVLTFFRQSLAQTHGIDLCLSLQDNLPILSSNGTKIRQILGNLIKNAIEAVEREGIIRVTAETITPAAGLPEGVRISVEDNGPGVLLPNIEEVFHAGITTKKEGHSGLGLAIVKKLATELGGTIACMKKQRGGMIFTLTLPI
jgi:HD-like signal output (HDOD) protein/signal transduction histidine kinase